jgi:hypothetical protein
VREGGRDCRREEKRRSSASFSCAGSLRDGYGEEEVEEDGVYISKLRRRRGLTATFRGGGGSWPSVPWAASHGPRSSPLWPPT